MRRRSRFDGWSPYVPVAERRLQAAKKVAAMAKRGRRVAPVEIVGRAIATTFWGKAWCSNLEAYSDYANRLPRGRTYVRNGSVVDLQVASGRVGALVSGSELYTVEITVKPLAKSRWQEVKRRCTGQVGSLVELLRGAISKGVMEIVTRPGEGLFPTPREITLSCSCPDSATMCKHVAATLYGVGARLDHQPELLFTLRGVDPTEMVEQAVDQPLPTRGAGARRVLEADHLAAVFGVELDLGEAPAVATPGSKRPPRKTKSTARAATEEAPKSTAKSSSRRSATDAPTAPANAGKGAAVKKDGSAKAVPAKSKKAPPRVR